MTLPEEVGRHVLPEVFGRHGDAPEHADDFADDARPRTLLEAAGFEVEAFERYRDGLRLGRDPADVLAWFARLPEGRVLETLGHAARQRLLDAFEAELTRRRRPDGVYLAGTAWIVEGRVPRSR